MKLRDIMTKQVVRIHPEETVTVAARMLEHNNIGAMPVCGNDGRLCGMITDRDIVIRCLASGRKPDTTSVREVMTTKVYVARPDMDVSMVAGLMGREQIRRLPVMDKGKLCGMISIGDLAEREESGLDAAEALTGISSRLSSRE